MPHLLELAAVATILSACSVDPSLETAEAATGGPLVVIMAEHDSGLLESFRALAKTRFLHLVSRDLPLTDGAEESAWFQAEVRGAFAELEQSALALEAHHEEVVPDTTLVLTGHSMGYDFWGDLGYLKTRPTGLGEDDPFLLSNLARQYPHAFARVRHVYLLGCNTGRKINLEVWRSLFPNAVSLLGFWQSGALGNPAYTVYHQTESALTPELVADPDAARAWLQDSDLDPAQRKKFGKNWSYVGLELFPPGGSGVYMVSNEDEFGDGECDQFICGAAPPAVDLDHADQKACENTYEGMSYDKYEQNRLSYESYFYAVPGFEDTNASGESSGPLRDYYNGVQGLADVYCCRSLDDPECPVMQREVETSQRLNHFDNVKNWWLSQHYWELEAERPGLAASLAFATARRDVLDLVSQYAGDECDRALALGVHTAIALQSPSQEILGRMADALCGLSFHELPESTAVTWRQGLIIPARP